MTRSFVVFALFAVPALLVGCHPDPVHSDHVSALGPEDPGVPTGPLHRPGQPCLVCHSDQGPASMVLSLAGTVYKEDGGRVPLSDALIRLIDSKGHRTVTATNCAGNFFVQKKAFDPVWPVWVKVEYNSLPVHMISPIFRDGSCGDCHHDPAGPGSAGHVYFAPSNAHYSFPPSGCK